MQLGLSLRNGDPLDDQLALARRADELGYAVVWAPEAYGTDSATVLAWIGAQTRRIDIGSGVFQIPARTPAMTAMTAATLDALSGGRFRLGLGVSGPQVSEGWHGVRFAAPLARTREYVDIVRAILARETAAYEGEHFTLPLPDGPGKALRLNLRPVRARIPTYLAAVGPRNLELAGEIADGWLAVFFVPEHANMARAAITMGRVRSGHDLIGFDVVATVPVALGSDVSACADAIRRYTALYVGGMGSRDQNFYNQLAVRMGYADAAHAVQDAYLDGRPRDAAALLPLELLDATALLGPPERVRDRLVAYAEAGVTTLSVEPQGRTIDVRVAVLATMADLLQEAGIAT